MAVKDLQFENIDLNYLKNDRVFKKSKQKQEKEFKALFKRQAKENGDFKKQQCTLVKNVKDGKK